MTQRTAYPLLSAIKDPAAQGAYKILCDRAAALEDRLTELENAALQIDENVDADSAKIQNLADGVAPTDAVTVQQLRITAYQQARTLVYDVRQGAVGITEYTAGDIIYASGEDSFATLGLGAANTFLKSDGSAPSWGTTTLLNGNFHSDTVAQTPTRGSIVYSNATPKWDELPIGAASTLLKSDGTDISWGTVNLLSAFHADTLAASVVRGDVIIGNATPKWSRLAVGAADTFLRTDGTDVAWSAITLGTNTTGNYTASVAGTADRVSVAGAVGEGQAAVVDIAATYVGQASITTLGTIATGVWNGTAVTVPYGGTGNTTFTAYSVICAGTTATGVFQNVSGVGTSGQVLTSNGAALLPTWQAASSGFPQTILTTSFEATSRFTETTDGAGAVTYTNNGLQLDTSATGTSSAKSEWNLINAVNNGGVFTTFPTEFSCSLSFDLLGTDVQAFVGLGNITGGGTGLTLTSEHIGFKLIRAASGACSLFATVADGVTETASAALTTLVVDDALDLAIRTVSGSSVLFSWRKNGGAWSSSTDLTSNIPTTATVEDASFINSNATVASRSVLRVAGAYFKR